MCRSLASLAAIAIACLFVASPTSPLNAQSSARQTVTVLVSPIVSLAVESASDSYDDTWLHYDLTTNVRGAILEAAVRSSSSSNVSLTLTASTNHGVSEGAVLLRSDGRAVPIVTRIQPGIENGQIISVSFDGDVPADLTLALTLRDPTNGVSQTVETGL